MKNWILIQKIEEHALRVLLLTTQEEGTLSALKKGFPQFFGPQRIEKISREALLSLITEREENGEYQVGPLLKDLEVPFEVIRCDGHCLGRVSGLPVVEGAYNTPNGKGEKFYRSTLSRGATVEYAGTTWVVARNRYSSGDGKSFSGHGLTLIPETFWE